MKGKGNKQIPILVLWAEMSRTCPHFRADLAAPKIYSWLSSPEKTGGLFVLVFFEKGPI